MWPCRGHMTSPPPSIRAGRGLVVRGGWWWWCRGGAAESDRVTGSANGVLKRGGLRRKTLPRERWGVGRGWGKIDRLIWGPRRSWCSVVRTTHTRTQTHTFYNTGITIAQLFRGSSYRRLTHKRPLFAEGCGLSASGRGRIWRTDASPPKFFFFFTLSGSGVFAHPPPKKS